MGLPPDKKQYAAVFDLKVFEALKRLAKDQDRKLSPTINLVCRDLFTYLTRTDF
ncbi:MAG: hypothetical protein K6U03_08580 [Firmicutes bacterium]|nr:hypothetical protein [Bacillota bacterium]